MPLQQLTPHLYRYPDTCNVYALRCQDQAVLIDFGSGRILPDLARAGVTRVSDILMTHHHRDQGQGLPGAPAPADHQSATRIWAPHTEQDLFKDVDAHWQARPIMNNYNMRQDRFSLLEPVALAGTLRDYADVEFGSYLFTVLPTPGHTIGSISLLTAADELRMAFSGDLIAAPGEVWSLAATQWTYNGVEGVAATILSLLSLKDRRLDVLLPSHGEPIFEVDKAIDLLVERLWELLQEHRQFPRLFDLRSRPFEAITPHLLRNRTGVANSYVLRSESGSALFFDFGYDFWVGAAAGTDRASRRPWLYNIEALKQQHDITEIEAVVPTHFHDDHVAGCNLLRDVEGAAVWAAENFASILQDPLRYDLPCLWYDPIPVDRILPIGQPLRWHEYELTLHALPGHTRYAVAISLEVDGTKVLVVGDQYQGNDGLRWNYVYHNGFEIDDYRASAEVYRQLAPDLILNGHWEPQWVQEGYFENLATRGATLSRLHRQLLSAEALGAGGEGFLAHVRPYQTMVAAGGHVDLCVELHNPLDHETEATISIVAPQGWSIEPASMTLLLPATESIDIPLLLTPPAGTDARRARVAVDVTIDKRQWGQQAEALVTVTPNSPSR